jgi:hypothetical protein
MNTDEARIFFNHAWTIINTIREVTEWRSVKVGGFMPIGVW